MKAIELVRWALQMTDEGTAKLVEGMRDAPLTQPTSNGGNHPLWVLGHLAVLEGSVPHILFGEPNPVEHWRPLFGTGSQPTTNPADYPSFDEVLKTFRELRAENLRRLDEVGDERLGETPRVVPPGFEDRMRTLGHTYLIITLHQMVHYGQITDARRVAGLKPLM